MIELLFLGVACFLLISLVLVGLGGLCRGTVHAVREKHMAYVLPGGAFSAAELQIIAAEASRKEDDCLKEALMALTWEVSEPGAMYTVPGEQQLVIT